MFEYVSCMTIMQKLKDTLNWKVNCTPENGKSAQRETKILLKSGLLHLKYFLILTVKKNVS